MKYFALIAALVVANLAAIGTAHAQSDADYKEIARRQRLAEGSGTSRDYRIENHVAVTMGGALMNIGVLGSVAAGYFATPDLLISVEYGHFEVMEIPREGRTAGASVKWFLFDAVYLSMGARWEQYRTNAGFGANLAAVIEAAGKGPFAGDEQDADLEVEWDNEVQVIVGSIGFGTQFQWKNFLIELGGMSLEIPAVVLENRRIYETPLPDSIQGPPPVDDREAVGFAVLYGTVKVGLAF